MSEIRLVNIEKLYDNGFQAVRKLTLDIADGEFVVLLGPSGCGKTTTLRMIAGLEDISAGDLYFDDERMNDKAPKERDVGMVFQNYALYPHLSVAENIAFPLRIQGLSKAAIAERVQEVAATLELGELLARRPKQLSGGQRQRVALGRAIVRRPRVFLFDEPLSNLDAKLRVLMRAEIMRLQRQVGRAAVYVTHDQTEAMTMGDRIVILNKGEVQQIGPPDEVYFNPANRFVAGFLGSPSMNFFQGLMDSDGSFQEEEGGAAFRIPPLALRNPPSSAARVSVGVRPEHLRLVPTGGANEIQLRARLELLEFLGHELLFHFNSGGSAKVGRRPHKHDAPHEGRDYDIAIDPDHIYVFDDQGQRI